MSPSTPGARFALRVLTASQILASRRLCTPGGIHWLGSNFGQYPVRLLPAHFFLKTCKKVLSMISGISESSPSSILTEMIWLLLWRVEATVWKKCVIFALLKPSNLSSLFWQRVEACKGGIQLVNFALEVVLWIYCNCQISRSKLDLELLSSTNLSRSKRIASLVYVGFSSPRSWPWFHNHFCSSSPKQTRPRHRVA